MKTAISVSITGWETLRGSREETDKCIQVQPAVEKLVSTCTHKSTIEEPNYEEKITRLI